jgi:hypothetical protein
VEANKTKQNILAAEYVIVTNLRVASISMLTVGRSYDGIHDLLLGVRPAIIIRN